MMRTYRKLAAILPVLAAVCHAAAQPGHDPSCYPLSTISQTYVSDNPGKMVAKDHYLFVGSWTEDVKIIDKSDPASPQLVATISAQGNIFIHNNFLFITKGNDFTGVLIYDVSDPEHPTFLTEMDPFLTNDVRGIAFYNNTAYFISRGNSTMLVYDISTPASPLFVSSTAGFPFPNPNLFADNDHVYIGSEGLKIVDVTNPESPSIVGELDWHAVDLPQSIHVQDGIAYLASDLLGLVTVNVSDPSNPFVLHPGFLFNRIELADRITSLEIHEDRAYLAQSSEDFNGDVFYYYYFGMVDISNPRVIRTVSYRTIDERVDAGAIHIDSNLAYLGGDQDLTVLDLSSICECTADFTDDGVLDFFDVSAFLNAFLSQDPIADLTGNGAIDFFDISAFLNAFDAGCP